MFLFIDSIINSIIILYFDCQFQKNMTSYQTYTQRYETISEMRRNSKSASKFTNSRLNLTANNQSLLPNPIENQIHNQQSNIGRVVSKIQSRVDGIQVKVVSLTNIVRLLQKYSQTKDDQYQKQKQNLFFKQTLGEKSIQIQTLQIDTKIKQFNILNKQLKQQIQSVEVLKHSFQQNFRQILEDSQKKIINAKKQNNPQRITLKFQIEQLQGRLREQLNKKIQICMKQIKKISSRPGDVNGIDQTFFEQQINSINFAINKIQNDCLRNRMIVQNQIQQIITKIRDQPIRKNRQKSLRRQKSFKGEKSLSKTLKSDRSFSRQKSSRSKVNDRILGDKRKIKEEQLREAIKKKRQNKQKLKNKL